MKIVIFGIGGVGGYFGGKLAKAGFDVTFIARGTHLEAIKKNGLTVKSIAGDFKAIPTLATANINNIENPDLIILGVKSWQVTATAKLIKPILAPQTMVLPLQNGANNVEELLKVLPKKNVIGGLSRIISFVESPGVINHFAFKPQLDYGELDNIKTERIQNLKAVFDSAGFENHISNDIQASIWAKFLFITTISGIGALTRSPIGVMRTDPYIKGLMQQTADEILSIAKAKNIAIDQSAITTAFTAIENQNPESTASMQRDLMEGKPSELENFNGYIVNEGKRLNIPTPLNEFIYRCLLPQENKARLGVKITNSTQK